MRLSVSTPKCFRRGRAATPLAWGYDKRVMLQRARCLWSAGLLSVGLLAAQTAPDPAVTARKALDLMLAGKYQELNQMFTPDGQKAFSVDTLTRLGGQIKGWGAVSSIGQPAVNRPGPNFVVVIPVAFATQSINFTLAVTLASPLAWRRQNQSPTCVIAEA